MPVFTPPVENYVPPIPADAGENDPAARLHRFYQPSARGVNVFKMADGTYPRDDVEGVWPTTDVVPNDAMAWAWGMGRLAPIVTPIPNEVLLVYYGGHSYPVTDAEAVNLTNAGYGPNLTYP
jgi:hypothetical protein